MEWSADPWLSYKSQIKKIVICPGITEIKHGAFIYLSSVTDVSIPDSVTKIGGYAFAECNGLTSIRLPDTVTEIDSYAFNRCQNLSSITLPKNLKTIGNYVFTDCFQLTDVSIPNGVVTIGNFAFCRCKALTEIRLPDSVTTIGTGAFSDCEQLESVKLPAGISSINQSLFEDCKRLNNVLIPDGVISIGECAFSDCENLENITLPGNLETIGFRAFNNCTALKAMTFPEKLKKLSWEIFAACTNLRELHFTGSMPTLDEKAFKTAGFVAFYPAKDSSYDAAGKPLEALHYVEVYGTGEDGILLLLDEVQVHALMSKTGCRAALVAHSGEEQLELQERINHPTISLKLPETATVAPGGTVQLDYTATIDPEEATIPAIQWETEDPEIAVITGDGEVQGVALGEVTITATCGTETAQCRLRVEVPLTNMTLSQEEMKLAPGNQGILQAIPEPEDASGFAVTWETSDPTVAEVTEIGVVRGLTEGTAIITARCGQWSASCSVTVRYSASFATLSEHNLTLTEGESVTLTADVQPTIAEDDVISWEIDDPAIATVDENGLVTAIAPGSAIITYRCGLAVAYCVLLVRKAPQ